MTATTSSPVVVTGASGFIGLRLLRLLAERGARDVVALVRDPKRLQQRAEWRDAERLGWRAAGAELTTDIAADAIPRHAVVLHLAAATGARERRVLYDVNVEGTRRLLSRAKEVEAPHFIFVSSIAAVLRDRRWYHYANAKREAEALVAASGIPFTIVRPTMVFGDGSPIERALVGLACGAAPMVLGSGEVRTQPVHVDDVSTLLATLVAERPAGDDLEVGGPERLTMRALLARIRAARALPAREPIAIPLGAVRALLGGVERILPFSLPVTAGQLAAFVNDTDARPHETVNCLMPHPRSLEAMLGARSA